MKLHIVLLHELQEGSWSNYGVLVVRICLSEQEADEWILDAKKDAIRAHWTLQDGSEDPVLKKEFLGEDPEPETREQWEELWKESLADVFEYEVQSITWEGGPKNVPDARLSEDKRVVGSDADRLREVANNPDPRD